MRRCGIRDLEVGLGIRIPRVPFLSIKFSSGFIFKVHLFFLGIYVRPQNIEEIERLSYREKAYIHGAGIIANAIMGVLIIISWTIVKLVKYPESLTTSLIVLVLLAAIIFVLWRFSKEISAYVFPFLGLAMLIYLIWSLTSVRAEGTVMGPVDLFAMGMGFVSLYQATIWGAYVSIGFAMINLLPFLPPDGGRIITEFLQYKFKAGKSVETVIKLASIAFFLAVAIISFLSGIFRI
jgi:Zn-dependent protease